MRVRVRDRLGRVKSSSNRTEILYAPNSMPTAIYCITIIAISLLLASAHNHEKWHFDGSEDNRHKSISKYVIKSIKFKHVHTISVPTNAIQLFRCQNDFERELDTTLPKWRRQSIFGRKHEFPIYFSNAKYWQNGTTHIHTPENFN